MRKHLLLIPFHFPPIQGSTGALRSLGFARWLPESDWQVTVLTAQVRAYPAVEEDNAQLLGRDMNVVRAFALDARRHLSIGGRYLQVSALPDRWATWIFGAILAGLKIIKQSRPDVLYTTYPIPSSHMIGWILHRITGIPWIAEYRDPMVEDGYPADPLQYSLRSWLEKKTFRFASRIVVVTPSARDFYIARAKRGESFVVEIPNGINDSMSEGSVAVKSSPENGIITVLHSGILYSAERDPSAMFKAIQMLKEQNRLNAGTVRFVFRGAGNEDFYRHQVSKVGIEDLVEFREQVPYHIAHEEMRGASALLLIQGSACNRQIPAKVYEYLALRKPLMCLADPAGDTGKLIKELGLGASAPLENVESVRAYIGEFLLAVERGRAPLVDEPVLLKLSRRFRAKQLSSLLNDVSAEPVL